jgi:hypothetical protein
LTIWFIVLFLWFSQIQNYNYKHCLHNMWLILLCLHLRANEQNEFVHVDFCKSLSHKSIGRSNYFSTFIDDFSHKIWIYFLKTNNEIFVKSKIFKKLIENLFGKKIIHWRPMKKKFYLSKIQFILWNSWNHH